MQRPRDGRISRAVSGQRLGKHDPAATDTNATIEDLCFLYGLCSDFISKGQGQGLVNSVRESVREELSWRQRNNHCWSRYQETFSNRLRTLDCVI
jgi:hypothetical protein